MIIYNLKAITFMIKIYIIIDKTSTTNNKTIEF